MESIEPHMQPTLTILQRSRKSAIWSKVLDKDCPNYLIYLLW